MMGGMGGGEKVRIIGKALIRLKTLQMDEEKATLIVAAIREICLLIVEMSH